MRNIIGFFKVRLTFLVVISAITGYLFVGGKSPNTLFFLVLGGFFVTAASNGANQIWERGRDAKMSRTQQRPLVTGALGLRQAYLLCSVSLLLGSVMLYAINLNVLMLGLFAFISYVFMYTPWKAKSPWAVFIGAFPGAIPPMLGAIAHLHDFGFIPGLLFFIQFMWQFPHFWSIAWVLHEDYQKAGYFLLPSRSGKSKFSASLIAMYSLLLIPISLIPWLLGLVGFFAMIVVGILGVWFYFLSYRLYTTCEDKEAKKLMFASFVYLPVIQFTYVFTSNEVVLQKLIEHGLF
jgi:protoheme IX farnesyltransferase